MKINKKKHKLIKNLKSDLKDLRGSILSLANTNCKNISLIISNKNTIRANHYHKTDWHFIYVLEGQFNYYYKEINSTKRYKLSIKKGDLLFTPAKLIHATHHTKKTSMIVISKNLRDKKNYEKDLVRVNFINNKNL